MDERVRAAMMEDIIHIVKTNMGMKLFEVVWALGQKLKGDSNRPSDVAIEEMVNELVQNKRLMMIEYSTDFAQVHCFVMPAKTAINIRGQENVPHRI